MSNGGGKFDKYKKTSESKLEKYKKSSPGSSIKETGDKLSTSIKEKSKPKKPARVEGKSSTLAAIIITILVLANIFVWVMVIMKVTG